MLVYSELTFNDNFLSVVCPKVTPIDLPPSSGEQNLTASSQRFLAARRPPDGLRLIVWRLRGGSSIDPSPFAW